MELKHKIGGCVYDTTREQWNYIIDIKNTSLYKHWYSLTLENPSTSLVGYTHYMSIKNLNKLYPYIGNNLETIKTLYGKN